MSARVEQMSQAMANLPRPLFSRQNPYWQPLQIAGVPPEYTPMLTAQDYAYATSWELNRFFRQSKLCILIRRIASPMWRLFWLLELKQVWRMKVNALRASKEGPFSHKGDMK